ncbi:MAG: hypothetical protein WD232_05815, partial [Acidimicrobiales bacterium]
MPDHLEARPATLRAVAAGVDGTADRFAGAVADLRSALAGVGDCWGGDEPGDAFGDRYEPASRNLSTHLDALVEGMASIGPGLRSMAEDFDGAEDASTI